MKSSIGLYGKVIITGIVAMLMIGLLLGPVNKTVFTLFRPPVATTGTADSEALIDDIANREKPTIKVGVIRMYKGKTYNLLDKNLYKIKTKNADGEECLYDVIKIVSPSKKEVDPAQASTFTPTEVGGYQITYRVYEYYKTALKEDTLTKSMAVDN